MRRSLEIEIVSGPDLPLRRWTLRDGLHIGRAASSTIMLDAASISREHAVIAVSGRRWTLRDCGSLIGTALNDVALVADEPAVLHAGDIIAIGAWRFRVVPATATRQKDGAIEESVARSAGIDVVAALGSLAERRLELLLGCADEVANASDEDALADALAEHALAGSGYARAAVLWHAGDDIVVRSVRPFTADDAAFEFNRDLVASAANGDLARIEPTDGTRAASERSVRVQRRALCAPLLLDGRVTAFLYLDSARSARRGHSDAPTSVQALARLATLALANLRRLAGERERAALAADLERAREVQQRFLPKSGLSLSAFDYALHLHPGRVVAGDIADVFVIDDGAVVALLGDVSGAGFGAGLVMASVQSFLRAEFGHHADPARAVERLNRHLCEQASNGRFVTLWLGVFDASTRACRFVDAGHGHAIVIGEGHGAALVARGDIPLGIDADAVFVSENLSLRASQTLLLYSDGVVEQRASDAAAFGRDRLLAAVSRAVDPVAAVTAALDALAAHAVGTPADDDTTLLAVGWKRR